MLWIIEHIVFTFVLAVLISIYYRKGPQNLLRVIVLALKEIPGVQGLIGLVLHREVTNFVQTTNLGTTTVSKVPPRVLIPKKGIPHDDLRKELQQMREKEINHEDGRIFAYTYTLNDEDFALQRDFFDTCETKLGHSVEHDALVKQFHHAFLQENALNPMIYPSLRKMETEIVSMTAGMLNSSSEAVGFLTSGGTESNLMAVKAYRDRARKLCPQITNPKIVAPITIHPTIGKAAHYFGLEVIYVPVGKDFRVNVGDMEKAITPDTVMLAASAPQFCHGIVDPIEAISDLAVRKGLPFHVDACFGGFMLPWVEKLGYPVPKFDFRNPGVTSMSADVHKYGYGVKGSSVIIYKNSEIRKHQIYVYAEWPGGLYGSPSMAGTRPGGNIAASWASMRALGEEGYMRKAKELMDTTKKMMDGVNKIPGLMILGQPSMTCFAIGSTNPDLNIQALADSMENTGWKIERNMYPDSIHCSILPHHVHVADKFIEDLGQAAKHTQDNKALAKKGTAAMYGMMATMPDKAIINDFIVEFFSEVYKCK